MGFASLSIFGAKFVTEKNREFFKSESIIRDFVLLFINFIDNNNNVSSHPYVVTKEHIIFGKFSYLGKKSQGNKAKG